MPGTGIMGTLLYQSLVRMRTRAGAGQPVKGGNTYWHMWVLDLGTGHTELNCSTCGYAQNMNEMWAGKLGLVVCLVEVTRNIHSDYATAPDCVRTRYVTGWLSWTTVSVGSHEIWGWAEPTTQMHPATCCRWQTDPEPAVAGTHKSQSEVIRKCFLGGIPNWTQTLATDKNHRMCSLTLDWASSLAISVQWTVCLDAHEGCDGQGI